MYSASLKLKLERLATADCSSLLTVFVVDMPHWEAKILRLRLFSKS